MKARVNEKAKDTLYQEFIGQEFEANIMPCELKEYSHIFCKICPGRVIFENSKGLPKGLPTIAGLTSSGCYGFLKGYILDFIETECKTKTESKKTGMRYIEL